MSNGQIGVKSDDGYGVRVKGDGGYGGGMRQPTRLPTPGMCFYHQQVPATYICNKCGRAVCHSCSEKYGTLTFCPQCNPYPGRPPAPQQPPPPERRGSFLTGAGGSILVGVMAIIIGILTVFFLMRGYYRLDPFLFLLLAIFTIIFLVGNILSGVGFMGFSSTYKSHFGVVALIFGIIAPIFLLILTFSAFSYEYSRYFGDYYYLNTFSLWIGHILVGIMFILMGVSSLLVGKHTGKRGLCIAAGTLLIVSGGMFIGLLGFIGAAWFVLSAAAFVQAAVFLSAPSQSQFKPPAPPAQAFNPYAPPPGY